MGTEELLGIQTWATTVKNLPRECVGFIGHLCSLFLIYTRHLEL